MKKPKYVNDMDGVPAQTPEQVLEKMEHRAKRAVFSVESRAKRAIRELIEREEEYKESIDDRAGQISDFRGTGGKYAAANGSAETLKNEISAVSAKTRNEIEERVGHFKDGIAVVRIEVDAQILTPEAACSFIDHVREHALKIQQRIDSDLIDTDAAMRRRMESFSAK